jgi:transposase
LRGTGGEVPPVYSPLAFDKESEVLETIQVKAYCRFIRRKVYKRGCVCKENRAPILLSAPTTERLLPKSNIGISIWALLLVNKYAYQQPLNRSLEQLRAHGLSLAMGTVVDGIQKLLPYFIPVYDAIVARSLAAKHWHADETGWKVFESVEGKKNHRWFLWIFHNQETVVYRMNASRSSQVLIDHFGKEHPGGKLNVDRYSAYKAIAKKGLFILAFCWAHVRRDFLSYAKGYPHQEDWALAWVNRIGELYHINNQRIAHQSSSKEFCEYDKALRGSVFSMRRTMEEEQAKPELLCSAKKLLKSLSRHWEGLTVFVEDPDIPMDNNLAERGLRGSVVGRKNYYGSGSVASAQLAAALFTLFETLKLWKLNIHTWLLGYFYECALLGGRPPDDVSPFIPWEMTEKQRELFAKPPCHEG